MSLGIHRHSQKKTKIQVFALLRQPVSGLRLKYRWSSGGPSTTSPNTATPVTLSVGGCIDSHSKYEKKTKIQGMTIAAISAIPKPLSLSSAAVAACGTHAAAPAARTGATTAVDCRCPVSGARGAMKAQPTFTMAMAANAPAMIPLTPARLLRMLAKTSGSPEQAQVSNAG